MPKPILNNKIIYQNIYGLISRHDGFLSQGVKQGDSPTFASLQLTGNATIEGNLYVEGNTTILNTNVIEFEDNIILLNRNETAAGVTLNQSGIEINRGSLENYRMIFNEQDDTFKIGFISNLQPVATREDSPLQNGIMMWNNSTKRIESKNTISIDIKLISTTNSTSPTTGSLILSGGLGIKKDIQSNGKIYLKNDAGDSVIWNDSNLNITSPNDINLTPITKIKIPFNKPLIFGSSTQNIYADSITNDINMYGAGHINFYLDAGKRINIPNQIPITFSTQNEKVYTDSSNNMVIAGSENISFIPGSNKKVIVPVDTGLIFGNSNQQLSSNLGNDLTILAGNNIILNPGPLLNVRIPTDNGIKFGNSGIQRIYANSSEELNILSSGDIYLTPQAGNHINIPDEIALTFNNSQYIISSNGNLELGSSNSIISKTPFIITNTQDSSNASTGSFYTLGGIGVNKTIYCDSNIIIDSDEQKSLLIRKNNNSQNIFWVDSNNNGKINVLSGNGSNEPSIEICSYSNLNALSLLQLQTQFDDTVGYAIGRGTTSINSGRVLTVNLPSYTDYSNFGDRSKFMITSNNGNEELFSIESDTGNIFSKGAFGLSNTQEAINASTASFVITGGLGVVKNVIINGSFEAKTNSTQAFLLKDQGNVNVFNIDTVNKSQTLNGELILNKLSGNVFSINNSLTANITQNTITNDFINHYTNTTDTTDVSTGSLIIDGGVSVNKKLRVSDTVYFSNELNMLDTKITNLKNPEDPKDAANKAYVDLVKQGLFVKDSVKVTTITSGNFNTDYIAGIVLDGYTLQLGDRILIKNQLSQVQNGIYIVQTSGEPQRSEDFQTNIHAAGTFVFVEKGNLNASLGWICNSDSGSDVVGTDSLNFTQFTALGQVEAGNGLSKNFNEMYINVDDVSLELFSDSLRIKNTATGTGLTGGSGSPLQTVFNQSHVTMLGTINTGSWEASTINVFYGGTGRTQFTAGTILFGNGIDGINSSRSLFYDINSKRLGLGTNQPLYTFHLEAADTNVSMLLNADSDGISATSKSQMIFSHSDQVKAYVGTTRNYNEYANDIYPESFVISHNYMDTTSILQFATKQQNRLTILANGNIGINTSNPSSKLDIVGTLSASDLISFKSTVNSTGISNGSVVVYGGIGISKDTNIGGKIKISSTIPSTTINTGALVIAGGISITCNQNSSNFGNGGALTVAGGASVGGDLYVAGTINGSGSSSSTFAYLTLTATDEAVNYTSGALVALGGITAQCLTNSSSITDGGALLIQGGASIGLDLYIGGNSYLYGISNYYSAENNILNFFDSALKKRFSLDRDFVSNDFSISLYDSDGNFVEKSLNISNQNGSITFANSVESSSVTSASLILMGGISINCTMDAKNIQNGGGLTLAGGASIQKNVFIGGDVIIESTTDSTNVSTGALIVNGGSSISKDLFIGQTLDVNNTVTFHDKVNYSNNGLFQTLINTDQTNFKWFYFGQVTEYCELDIKNGISDNTDNAFYGMKLITSVSDTTCTNSHNHYGNLSFDNSNTSTAFIYKTNDSYHLFLKVAPSSTTAIHVSLQIGPRFIITDEGTNATPDGSYSGFDSWTVYYATNTHSNLKYEFGNVIANGNIFKSSDNLPIFGYNNAETNESRNLGVLFQRYQSQNDSGLGELVNDPSVFIDSLPDQSTASSNQIKFSNLTSSVDHYYDGWWVKIGTGSNINQVRKITNYNGSQRVAYLDSPWTTQNPSIGDTVYFYNGQYVSLYYNQILRTFQLTYNTIDDNTNTVTNYSFADLELQHLSLYDTTPSLNASSGSLMSLGGISIQNTSDAGSITEGGTFTTLGGASIKKKLFVGDNISLGQSYFQPQESLHIHQENATIRLEHDTNEYSYIDFVEHASDSRFGIVHNSYTDQLSLTYTTNNQTPINSNNALTVTLTGYVGINTTSNINSPLTIKSNNFISTNSNDGYIGLISANTNINDTSNSGKVLVYGNNHLTNAGDVVISSGTTGSIKFYTNDETELVNINKKGIVNIESTQYTKNSTSGALIVTGGVAISGTENAESVNNGGSLTIAGGASIQKDIWIGGNLYITGNLNAGGSVTQPEITFSNTVNCSINTYEDNTLVTVSNAGFFPIMLKSLLLWKVLIANSNIHYQEELMHLLIVEKLFLVAPRIPMIQN